MLLCTALILLASLPFSAQRTTSDLAQNTTAAEAAERALLERINQERSQRGLPPLHRDDRLVKAARAHSQLMAEKHLLSHGFSNEPALPQRLVKAGLRFDASAENVAFGPTPDKIHGGLMDSPPHRANILNAQFDAVGVGVVQQNGLLWATQDFARRLPFHSVEEAENIVARKFADLRRQSGQPPLNRASLPQLRAIACRMAHSNRLDTRSALDLVGSGSALAFSSSDISAVPESVHRAAARPGFSKYSLGVCFEESDTYPSGGYWVVMIFY